MYSPGRRIVRPLLPIAAAALLIPAGAAVKRAEQGAQAKPQSADQVQMAGKRTTTSKGTGRRIR